MDQPQPSEGALAERIVLQRGKEDAFRIADNDVGDGPLAVYQYPDVPVQFIRKASQVSAELDGDDLAMKPAPVDLLKRAGLASLEAAQFSVKYRYLEPPRVIRVTMHMIHCST
ncbi:MAG: hypothetical protein WA610_00610 [Thermodesulfovibrionales bacterium]